MWSYQLAEVGAAGQTNGAVAQHGRRRRSRRGRCAGADESWAADRKLVCSVARGRVRPSPDPEDSVTCDRWRCHRRSI